MATQRVKVCLSIPVLVTVYATEQGLGSERVTYESPRDLEHINVTGVVEVDRALTGQERDLAAQQVAMQSLAGILSAEMDQPGMLGFPRRDR